ncbi:uncharacterized protein ATNIH1004_007444 [Aspergillus tanneri]|uniref:Uncharacterized protein n=1 Tax=Aspergillus tanneri TaxID=1220188 RepID=A0A5M9MGC4_9EURO|nr:uncharacterized protein ATNIH1004_007444 [Aspergillus tanneri]KAA8646022.1 hypothetical protein ATNIH1004_007444 [Aspergillus tanneri]
MRPRATLGLRTQDRTAEVKAPFPLSSVGLIVSCYHIGSLNRTVHGIADPLFLLDEVGSGFRNGTHLREFNPVYSEGCSLPLCCMADALTPVLVPPQPFFSPHCASKTRMLVSQSMKRARKLAEKWTVPDRSSFPDKPEARGPPPVVLLRYKVYVPHEKLQNGVPSLVSADRWRHLCMLGWEISGGLVRKVMIIPRHHLNVMWEDNLDALTTELKIASKMIDLSMVK